jgi:myo-inositol catabolism protein IolS
MRRIRLGRTGAETSAVGLGSWGMGGPRIVKGKGEGWSGGDDGESRRALVRAFELGITHWDTADVYGGGHAEELIGEAWRDVPRDEIFLASKVGWIRGDHPHHYHPDQMRIQLETSLRNLRTDVIDLYYFHHCRFGPDGEYLDDALATMHGFRDEGKIRSIGLSDWSSDEVMRYVERIDPDSVQVYRNVVDDDYQSSGLRAWVNEHDVGVVFFSPLRHGVLLGKYDRPPEFGEGDMRAYLDEFNDEAFLAAMRRNAERLRERFGDREQPVLHALVGALLDDPERTSVLVGQRSPAQAEAAASVGEPLAPDEARWVRELYAVPVAAG